MNEDRAVGGQAEPALIYVKQELHPDATRLLRESGVRVVLGYGPDRVPLEQVGDDVGAVVVRYDGISRAELSLVPHLAAIARAGVGFENIDLDTARERGIPVYITSTANSLSVAEHVFTLALSVAKAVPTWDALAREVPDDLDQQRERSLGTTISGGTMGLIGTGRVGQHVARIARGGFEMDLVAYHPSRSEEPGLTGVRFSRNLDEVLAMADIVSVQAPLTEQTRGMFDARAFAQMKPSAIFVNVARGELVVDGDLAQALRDGVIAGAGIDVWHHKLPRRGNPLLELPNAVLTPHRAGRTEDAQAQMGIRAARAALDTVLGHEVSGVLDVLAVDGRRSA